MSYRNTFLQNAALLLGCVIPFIFQSTSPRIEVHVTGTTDSLAISYVESQFLDVATRLPSHFLESLNGDRPYSIHLSQLNDQLAPEDFCRLKGRRFGYYDRKKERIVVSKLLVALSITNADTPEDTIACFHKSIQATFKATLVHELAHAYDSRYKLSARKEFRAMVAGSRKKRLLRKNRINNYNATASPDPYEFTNPKEAFATNFEYYVLDPQYVCAKPAFASFYDAAFGIDSERQCDGYRGVLVHSHIAADNLQRLVSLSSDQIYEVHYLHATEGKSIASRWGHAMFRLVVCAPFREQVGPACLEDSAHHLVLSYRANVADVQISYLRGLLGAYPSQLFIYRLPEIIKEYNRLEFRGMLSIPLTFTREELDQFLNLSLERYWNYQGKYFFVTNHCGTETLKQLAAVHAEKAASTRSRTPRKLLKTLVKSPWVDPGVFSEIVASEEASVYNFPSKEPHYQTALSVVQSYGLFSSWPLGHVLHKTNAIERKSIYTSFFADSTYLSFSAHEKQKVVVNVLLLERLIQNLERKKLMEEMIVLLNKDASGVIDSIRSTLEQLYQEPWHLIPDKSYGVPHERALNAYLGTSEERRRVQGDVEGILRHHPPLAGVLAHIDTLHDVEQLLTVELTTRR